MKKSAVIILWEQSTDSIILTQRSDSLRDHPGEICFPGGRWDPGDADLWSTALRELYEELGIVAGRVQLVKELLPEKTLAGSIIYPWLATVPNMQPYTLNDDEVAAVFTLPMHEVIQASNYHDVLVTIHGRSINACQFMASEHFVWGATARIMKQLCHTSLLSTKEKY